MTKQKLNISTGEPSTLKTYRKLASLLFPKALPMLDARIEKFGDAEEVVQDERQMIYLLGQIQFHNAPEFPAVIFCEGEGTLDCRGYAVDAGDATVREEKT